MENYGIFKQLMGDNHYVSLAKSLNSAVSTKKTLATMKRITKKEIVYSHMGQLVIKDRICYSTFLQNTGSDGEDHHSVTSGVVLAIFSLDRIMSDDFDVDKDIEFYPVGKKGDTCAGYNSISIFKDNSMCLVGDKLYVCFSFTAEDGKSHIFRKTFDICKKEWVEEVAVELEYKGKKYSFTDETLNIVYTDKGLEPRAKGLIELVSAWSEYKGEYYATGIAIERPNNGFIVKTTDFKTMTLVDAVPFNDMGTAEIGSYIYKGMLFVACRQFYGIPYMYIGFYDLEAGQWKHHYKMADANSRPWFFVYKEQLYLMNSVEEVFRGYTNISRIKTFDHDVFKNKVPIETLATLRDIGMYQATAEYDGEVYFVCSKNTESFGKLCLELHNPDEVNEKFIELFK